MGCFFLFYVFFIYVYFFLSNVNNIDRINVRHMLFTYLVSFIFLKNVFLFQKKKDWKEHVVSDKSHKNRTRGNKVARILQHYRNVVMERQSERRIMVNERNGREVG